MMTGPNTGPKYYDAPIDRETWKAIQAAGAAGIDAAATEWIARPIDIRLGHAPGAPMMVLGRVHLSPTRAWSFVFIAPAGATPRTLEDLAWWQVSILKATAGLAQKGTGT